MKALRYQIMLGDGTLAKTESGCILVCETKEEAQEVISFHQNSYSGLPDSRFFDKWARAQVVEMRAATCNQKEGAVERFWVLKRQYVFEARYLKDFKYNELEGEAFEYTDELDKARRFESFYHAQSALLEETYASGKRGCGYNSSLVPSLVSFKLTEVDYIPS